MSNFVSKFEQDIDIVSEDRGTRVVHIPLDQVEPDPNQVRGIFDEEKLDELANSIKQHGILNPIHVLKSNNKYIIITGERRYRGSKIAEQTTVPCIVHESMNEKKKKALMLIENMQRENLSAIETAKGMQSLIEAGVKQRLIANELGVSAANVSKYLSIVNPNKMEPEWLSNIEENYKQASLKELYEIVKASKNQRKKKYIKLMEKAELDIEIEEEEIIPKQPMKLEITEEECLAFWELLKKKTRNDKTKLLEYISVKKIKSALEEDE